ncbi:putative toxin-antitoxin system toxin component, PIN family [Dyella sp. GSA-30]|uniref:putative toxin-antitoxin system toxin component, PIN family n=1 Tax=Dyella sp. GSA-30 TaxID=2994496 RepID=UPI002492F1D2|nr:putative toxin-antitoxin system toxin component, PIN family [Dyella sp. GSA-30]
MSKASSAIPRVVLDTNVCLDAFVFADPHAETLLRTLQRGAVHALIDQACRDEWLRVITYPQFALDNDRQQRATEQLDRCLRYLPAEGRASRDIVLPLCKDTDDQKFLELALAAQAQWLITKDKELLKLGRRTLRDAGFAILTLKEWDARFTLV